VPAWVTGAFGGSWGHGVISWAESSEESESLSLSLIEQAERYLAEQWCQTLDGPPRAGQSRRPDEERRRRVATLAPVVPGLPSTDGVHSVVPSAFLR
jgi:rhamnose utilization protein RhaD (predicted bifunctional aldolase and dehydrogenase)